MRLYLFGFLTILTGFVPAADAQVRIHGLGEVDFPWNQQRNRPTNPSKWQRIEQAGGIVAIPTVVGRLLGGKKGMVYGSIIGGGAALINDSRHHGRGRTNGYTTGGVQRQPWLVIQQAPQQTVTQDAAQESQRQLELEERVRQLEGLLAHHAREVTPAAAPPPTSAPSPPAPPTSQLQPCADCQVKDEGETIRYGSAAASIPRTKHAMYFEVEEVDWAELFVDDKKAGEIRPGKIFEFTSDTPYHGYHAVAPAGVQDPNRSLRFGFRGEQLYYRSESFKTKKGERRTKIVFSRTKKD